MNGLSNETEITLLLCGSFNNKSDSEIKPLTATEYYRLVDWMRESALNISDLSRSEICDRIPESGLHNIAKDRLIALLGRGGTIEGAIGNWREKGIWILSALDTAYPKKLLQRLLKQAPPLLFGIGRQPLLNDGGLAIVGSREADTAALEFTKRIATECADAELQVVSGGARGIDREAMSAALEAGGRTLGVLADSLGREAASGRHDLFLEQRRLALVSPYHPDAGFTVGNAMGRNKCIYALADWSLVVSSAANEGGTWTGAVENFKHRWTPLLVRDGNDIPEGNRRRGSEGRAAGGESVGAEQSARSGPGHATGAAGHAGGPAGPAAGASAAASAATGGAAGSTARRTATAPTTGRAAGTAAGRTESTAAR
jgi:predicted Rossmann fold nucleotide-binding protein DprA/Smf involved in DNA uptake